MTNLTFLFDVAPDPVSTGIGVAGLILIAVVVLMITAATVVGFVFLVKRLLRAKMPASPQVTPEFQPNNPNQR